METSKKASRHEHRRFVFFDRHFLTGMASVLDVLGQVHRPNPYETDLEALRRDYRMVRDDFWKALHYYESCIRSQHGGQEERLFDPDDFDHAER